MQSNQLLSPLENQIATVIEQHPEYHKLLSNPEQHLDKDYLPQFGETNPFLHMSLHLGVRDQVNTNRPSGIKKLYQEACEQYKDNLEVEHKMMEALTEAMWLMQRNQQPLSDDAYLSLIKKNLLVS